VKRSSYAISSDGIIKALNIHLEEIILWQMSVDGRYVATTPIVEKAAWEPDGSSEKSQELLAAEDRFIRGNEYSLAAEFKCFSVIFNHPKSQLAHLPTMSNTILTNP
jgi:hypothetical protein